MTPRRGPQYAPNSKLKTLDPIGCADMPHPDYLPPEIGWPLVVATMCVLWLLAKRQTR